MPRDGMNRRQLLLTAVASALPVGRGRALEAAYTAWIASRASVIATATLASEPGWRPAARFSAWALAGHLPRRQVPSRSLWRTFRRWLCRCGCSGLQTL